MKRLGLVLVIALLSCGCGEGKMGPAPDAGGDPSDSGTMPIPLPEGAEEAAVALVTGATLAEALSGPLVTASDGLFRDSATVTEADARTRIEDAFSTMSVVMPPGCAMFSWSGLTATVTLTGCTVVATGATLDGSITLAVMLRPTTLSMSFDALRVGPSTLTGSVTLTKAGTPDAPMQLVDAMLAIEPDGAQVTLTDVTLTESETGVTLDGAATVTMSGATPIAITMNDLHWAPTDCLPDGGSLELSTSPPVTITILSCTPWTGVVTVEVGSLPPTNQFLFSPACRVAAPPPAP